jgi:hypothetical protein
MRFVAAKRANDGHGVITNIFLRLPLLDGRGIRRGAAIGAGVMHGKPQDSVKSRKDAWSHFHALRDMVTT